MSDARHIANAKKMMNMRDAMERFCMLWMIYTMHSLRVCSNEKKNVEEIVLDTDKLPLK